MSGVKLTGNRIVTDAAGYGLLLAALLTGWLPGPGGIPLALAGLGLLSIHNAWARRLRRYVERHSGKLMAVLFRDHWLVQLLYDVLAGIVLLAAGILANRHAAIWEVSLAATLFFLAIFLVLMNRDRFKRLKKHK